jgi:hypothetical protein
VIAGTSTETGSGGCCLAKERLRCSDRSSARSRVVAGIGPEVFASDVVLGFALNLVQAWFFRRQGFVSSIAVREGYYLIWHVLYVH